MSADQVGREANDQEAEEMFAALAAFEPVLIVPPEWLQPRRHEPKVSRILRRRNA